MNIDTEQLKQDTDSLAKILGYLLIITGLPLLITAYQSLTVGLQVKIDGEPASPLQAWTVSIVMLTLIQLMLFSVAAVSVIGVKGIIDRYTKEDEDGEEK